MSTNIQSELKKKKENINLYLNKSEDEKLWIFAAQKEDIQKIQSTEWFKHIQMYWISQEMDAIGEIEDVDPEDKYKVAKIQAKLKMAKKFNMYLNTRLKN